MNPIKVFGVLAALLAAVAALALLSRDEPRTPTPAEAATPIADLSLTDAEAVARFEELHAELRHASRNRSIARALAVVVGGSPLEKVVKREIEQLTEDRVLDRSELATVSVEVLQNGPNGISVQQRVRVEPRFVAEDSGREVTRSGATVETVNWKLKLDGTQWLVYDAVVIKQRKSQ